MSAAISVSALHFSWDDGTAVLSGLDLDLGPGRTGLIGVNGSGKSTLLRLLAGELGPTSGAVTATGEIGYLPQDLPLARSRTVSDLLGITEVRAALHAIEAGEVDEEHFALVEGAWDVEERARAELDRLGLGTVDLERTVARLSGGEAMLVALAGLLLRKPAVLLLDEPTNNLDLVARRRLYAAMEAWTGVLVVVSHDRALLDRVDQVADLRDGKVRVFGGNLSAYEEVLEVEQAAAERLVRSAEADLRREKRDLIEARLELDRRERYAKKDFENKRRPKVIMQARKREAQVSAGKLRDLHTDRVDAAKDRLTQAEARVRADAEIRVDLPETRVPTGRTVITLTGVRTIVGDLRPLAGELRVRVDGVRYLPQRLDMLDDTASVVDNVRRFAPSATVDAVRARLARFLFTGERAELPAAALSGGERFRAVLVALLSAEPPPQLLVLDEPTNNLDLASVRQLTCALEAYEGALIVASHDEPFLASIGIDRRLELTRDVRTS